MLFRIAFTEFKEDEKWARASAGHDTVGTVSAIEKHWTDFKQAYSAKYPEHPLVEENVFLRDVAKCASIEPYYDTHYRLYCRFTHAAFRATTGSLNEFDREDNRTMTLCALGGVEALVSIGAPAPNIESLRERLGCLGETMK